MLIKSRFFSALVFAAVLLTGQQGSALHMLRHAMTEGLQQQKKQASTTQDCEQCISYAPLGSALHSSDISFIPADTADTAFQQAPLARITQQALPTSARGPPLSCLTA